MIFVFDVCVICFSSVSVICFGVISIIPLANILFKCFKTYNNNYDFDKSHKDNYRNYDFHNCMIINLKL